jgi:general secretion pathway protein A
MDYLDFYELSQEPFSNAPVSRFYYDSVQHGQALQRLRYAAAADEGPGHPRRRYRRRQDHARAPPARRARRARVRGRAVGDHPLRDITADWLLRRIAVQLGVENPATDKLSLLGQLYRRLVEIYEQGKKAVVLIDEAQMLASQELMEEFRGLLNLEVPERKLISFVFFGLPDIEVNLQFDPPLAQRVALRVHLHPFDLAPRALTSTTACARPARGARPSIWRPTRVIHRASGGICRA